MTNHDLRAKYGERAYDIGRKLFPRGFERRVARRDALDQHYTKLWLDFGMAAMGDRPVLDTRTRLLVLVGQFTMAKCMPLLDDAIRGAIAAKVRAREVLEIILQCTVYGGQTTVEPALDLFYEIAEASGLLDALRTDQLPMDGNDRRRSLEEERKTWRPADAADARREGLMQKHGWLGVGRGIALRPGHHLNTLSWHDALDSEWAGHWVRFTYQGMYSRGIVDDKTRLLCMVGDCVAVGEATEGRSHMRGAMRNGASPREVMEVILQSAIYFGMPPMLKALKTFVQIMTEDGRLAEIGNPPTRAESR